MSIQGNTDVTEKEYQLRDIGMIKMKFEEVYAGSVKKIYVHT